MGEIPKHEPSKNTKGAKKKRLTLADMPHMKDHGAFVDMSGVAHEIGRFVSIFDTWVSRELAGDNAQPMYSSPTGHPVKVALTSLDGDEEALHGVELELTGEVAHSIADSLKRIADAMTQRNAP